jgi:hypothetical protein
LPNAGSNAGRRRQAEAALLQCTADTLADAVLITTVHAWQHQENLIYQPENLPD